MKYILLTILVLLTLIAGGGLYLFFYVKKRAQKYAREFYGTSNLSDAMKKSMHQAAGTPKSLSAMTRIELPRIVNDFPEFNYDEMKKRAEGILTGYLIGIAAKNPGAVTGVTSELRKKLEDYITMLKQNGSTEHYENLHIHRTEISRYVRESGRCIITFQSAAEFLHYVTDRDGNTISGSRDYKEQARFDISMVYIQDRDIVDTETVSGKSLNCPNCGAPISSLGVKVCSYCGTGIVEYNIHVWSFDDVSAG